MRLKEIAIKFSVILMLDITFTSTGPVCLICALVAGILLGYLRLPSRVTGK